MTSTDEPEITRILSVEDHVLVSEGISLIVNAQPDMKMVGVAASAGAAETLFSQCDPHVVLMDLRLGSGSGVDVIRTIRKRSHKVGIIVLTMYQGDEDIRLALEAGASAYVVKNANSSELLRVIRKVRAGTMPDQELLTTRVDEWGPETRLTKRETQVITLVAKGLKNKDIGIALTISGETVEVHLRNIFEKFGADDRTAAVNVALHRGILHLD
jgi:DNA-binding NarL/FixJ family response regulator